MCVRDCRLCNNSFAWANSEEEALQDGYAECVLDGETRRVSNPTETAMNCHFYEYSDVYPRS